MLPILQPAQVRCNHGTDGTGISRAISMSANVAENRANIQASTTANAVQRIALLGIGQEFRAPIIEQNDVIFLRAIGFAGLSRAAIKRIVTGYRLAGARRREHGKKKREVLKARQNFFNAEQ